MVDIPIDVAIEAVQSNQVKIRMSISSMAVHHRIVVTVIHHRLRVDRWLCHNIAVARCAPDIAGRRHPIAVVRAIVVLMSVDLSKCRTQVLPERELFVVLCRCTLGDVVIDSVVVGRRINV